MMVKHLPQKPDTQLLIYQTESGDTKIEVRLEDETVWLTQKLMAELFQTTPQNITLHLKNIFEEGELADDFVAQIQSQAGNSCRIKDDILGRCLSII